MAISPDFTASQQAAIVRAVDNWCRDTAQRVCFSANIGTEADVLIAPHPAEGQVVGHTLSTDSHAAIWLDANWLESWFAEDQMPDGVVAGSRLTYTAMHELGHALGLGHEDDTLMRRIGAAAPVVDPVTRNKLGL